MKFTPKTKNRNRAIVIHPNFLNPPAKTKEKKGYHLRSPEAKLNEMVSLTKAINIEVVFARVYNIKNIKPATIFTQNAIDEMMAQINLKEVDVVIIDTSLTPIQQRNLEKKLDKKVIDKTGLILEIFGERAKTKEGEFQVELASLQYQRSRLVRSWTHLERQRGGFGFTGGPGESQLEIDRRLIDNRIKKIRKNLEKVKLTRGLHRKARTKVPYPIIALVGYTNAGKSTLFNRLTRENVLAEDMLFATLDPTMRKIKLSGGREVIISDTVGFISDLPTLLVEAFKATLEEVLNADIILHVQDISHNDSEAQRADVIEILHELGIDVNSYSRCGRYIEVLNKIDLLDEEQKQLYIKKNNTNKYDTPQISLSSTTGDGIQSLLKIIARSISKINKESYYEIITSSELSGQVIAYIHKNGTIIDTKPVDNDMLKITFITSEKNFNKLSKIIKNENI